MNASMHDLAVRYLNAFQSEDLDAIAELISPDVILQDPVVGVVRGKKAVLAVYKDIFAAYSEVDLEMKRIFLGEDETLAMEFSLRLQRSSNETIIIEGIDVMEFSGSTIIHLRAYLDQLS